MNENNSQRQPWSTPSSETLRDAEMEPTSSRDQREGKGKKMDDHTSSADTLHAEVERSSTQEKDQRADSREIIRLTLDDPEHPNNWPKSKKTLVFSTGIMTVIHSTLGSSLPSNAVDYIARDFNVTSQIQLVLPISCFLIGYCFAPILCGPLSEAYGRKLVMQISFFTLTICTMLCAVAPTWGSLLFFRFLCGLAASAPIACVAGIFADINGNPRVRGQTLAIFLAFTVVPPAVAPALSGFIAENTTWRWVFGVGAIFAGATLPLVMFLPETYAPIILSKRAARLRKETGNQNIIAESDLQKKSWKYVTSVVMTRPFRMLFQELIVSTTCLYLSLCYAIFYLYFEAYPIIFQGPNSVYKFSPGIAGLTFLPIGIGSFLSFFVFWFWDAYLARAQAQNKAWSQKEEYRRLPLALFGGPFFSISILWLGWSARDGVHWLAPTASGVAFGAGFVLIFMAMLNYLADAYMTFSASAQGIASTTRSLFGVLLPLASHDMFMNLGISWACTTLALLSLLLAMVPFLFIRYGEKIRANSKFCQELQALREKELEEQRNREEASKEV